MKEIKDTQNRFYHKKYFDEIRVVPSNAEVYKLVLTSGCYNTKHKLLLAKAIEIVDADKRSIFVIDFGDLIIASALAEICNQLGFNQIYLSSSYDNKKKPMPDNVSSILVPESNNLAVLVSYIEDNGFDLYIRNQVLMNGATYIGASAGAFIISNDHCIAERIGEAIYGYKSLGLIPTTSGKTDIILPHTTYKELELFCSELTEIERARYNNIFNIRDDEALMLYCEKKENDKVIVAKKRLRI